MDFSFVLGVFFEVQKYWLTCRPLACSLLALLGALRRKEVRVLVKGRSISLGLQSNREKLLGKKLRACKLKYHVRCTTYVIFPY